MNYLLTLSRWHKVAERIHNALKEREANVRTTFTATTISPWNRYGVEERAALIARRAAGDLALVEAGTRAIATIRAVLARRNAELGISGRLAEVEAARRRAVLYQAVIEGQDADMVRPESLSALPSAVSSTPLGVRATSLACITFSSRRRLLLSAGVLNPNASAARPR